MGKNLPVFPQYVEPTIPNEIKNQGNINLQTINDFLSGKFDPQADMFKGYWDIMDTYENKASKKLSQDILSAQGGQRIYGGAAGKQLNEALGQRATDALAQKYQNLMEQLGYIIQNRQFGLSSSLGLVDSEKQYAVGQADRRNAYEASNWEAQVQNTLYRRQNANTFKNWLPAILEGARIITGTAKNVASAGAGGGL